LIIKHAFAFSYKQHTWLHTGIDLLKSVVKQNVDMQKY
jgi:hypothetical protein